MNSAVRSSNPAMQVWRGSVRHTRLTPKKHTFSYPMTMWRFQPRQANEAFASSGYGWRKPSILRFCDQDYLPNDNADAGDLHQRVQRLVREHGGPEINGRIELLTVPRQWGLIFNPVSFMIAFAYPESQEPAAIVAEITNTPWNERHSYVLLSDQATQQNGSMLWDFDKIFHISPFNPMQQHYRWQFAFTDREIRITMRNDSSDDVSQQSTSSNKPCFIATLVLRKTRSRWRALWSQPLGGIQLLIRIYRQAAALWRKGVPFYDHPDTPSHPTPINGTAPQPKAGREDPIHA